MIVSLITHVKSFRF